MKPNKTAVMFGVIAGLVYCVFSTVFWSMGTGPYVSFLSWYTWLPIFFALFMYAAFQYRKQAGGFLEFKQVLQFVFLAYVVYEAIYAVYYIVLYTVIDKELTAKVMQVTLENIRRMLEKFGASEDKIEEAVAKAQKNDTSVLKQTFLGFGLALVLDFVKSMIIAAIVKKEKKFTDS